MTIERRNFPQFFITAPAPCPYLPGRVERKVFTHLIGTDALSLNTHLSHGGFRRSQNIAYRPACEGCAACVSVRVVVEDFEPSRTQRRLAGRNADLVAVNARSRISSEHYGLFRRYIEARHGDGGMAGMSPLDFGAMVDDRFVDSRFVEYRVSTPSGPGELIAALLADRLTDGISMVYSFFDTERASRSLGTYMILDQIRQARREGLPYVYLGYWVKGSRKMNYKGSFLPQERLTPEGWRLHVAA